MWRYGLWQAGRLVASLIGAVLLASLLAALSHPAHGTWAYFGAFSNVITNAARGDFGKSLISGRPAWHAVADVLPATLQLIFAGVLVAMAIGIPLGALLSASRMLRAAAPLMQIIAAAPIFCAALAIVWFAVHVLQWNPPVSAGALGWKDFSTHGGWNASMGGFVLATITVGAAGAAAVQLCLRRTAQAILTAPYRKGLRMMGLDAWQIDLRYTAPQFAAGLLRNLGDIVLALLAAAAVAEWVFDRQGAAVLFLTSASREDWNVAALVLLIFGTIKIGADVIGDVAAHLLVSGGAMP